MKQILKGGGTEAGICAGLRGSCCGLGTISTSGTVPPTTHLYLSICPSPLLLSGVNIKGFASSACPVEAVAPEQLITASRSAKRLKTGFSFTPALETNTSERMVEFCRMLMAL